MYTNGLINGVIRFAMTLAEFRQLLHRYRAGTTQPDETQQLDAWYDSLGADGEDVTDAGEEERVRLRMWWHIDAETRTVVRPLPVYRQNWFRVAAAVLLVLGFLGYQFWSRSAGADERMSTHLNRTQQSMRLTLADGSRVTLEPGSLLQYPRQFSADKREVFLTGDAVFDVIRQPERPFLVVTEHLVTKVLGTSFRVQAPGGMANASVTVRTGKVSVFSRPGGGKSAQELASAVVLVPNQRAVYYPDNARLVKTLAEKPILLTSPGQQSSFVFTDTPLPDVFRRLELAYGVDFVFDAQTLAACTLTAQLNAESLYESLTLIGEVTRIRYEIIDGQVIIDSKGCLATPGTSNR